MRNHIFTSRERTALEKFLTKTEAGNNEIARVVEKIKKSSSLFEDVYLYLEVRKTLGQ